MILESRSGNDGNMSRSRTVGHTDSNEVALGVCSITPILLVTCYTIANHIGSVQRSQQLLYTKV